MKGFGCIRRAFHEALGRTTIRTPDGVPSFADRTSEVSSAIARRVLEHMDVEVGSDKVTPQASGIRFAEAVVGFLSRALPVVNPACSLGIEVRVARASDRIWAFDQYDHLRTLERKAADDPELAAVLGSGYVVMPDVVVSRGPVPPDGSCVEEAQVGAAIPCDLSPLRCGSTRPPLLHASVSCKYTMRSDRAQNARTEALNLLRNRKGRAPHIVFVTMEPLPSRLASIALGTGDVDCTYHGALHELQKAVADGARGDAARTLHDLISGRRLRDIADLAYDLFG